MDLKEGACSPKQGGGDSGLFRVNVLRQHPQRAGGQKLKGVRNDLKRDHRSKGKSCGALPQWRETTTLRVEGAEADQSIDVRAKKWDNPRKGGRGGRKKAYPRLRGKNPCDRGRGKDIGACRRRGAKGQFVRHEDRNAQKAEGRAQRLLLMFTVPFYCQSREDNLDSPEGSCIAVGGMGGR